MYSDQKVLPQAMYSVVYSDSNTHRPRYITVSRPTIMPVQAPSWTEFLICPICTNEFEAVLRAPITLRCGHTICKKCLANVQQCPYDQSTISKHLENLPVNYALLQLVTTSTDINAEQQEILPSIVESLTAEELQYYKVAKRFIEELALYLKPNGAVAGLFSRPMQRKLVTLINCQLVEEEGRVRSMRAARSLGERTVTELILQHQNPQQLSANLWAAVRARGCQFLGPAMQEEVLSLVLLALADGVSLCRKVLVMYVVQKLEATFPQASKTSIGHVVQLLYRASCFHVTKREGDSSLMQLKEEFRTYKNLRKEHDAQIVQIATEAGLRIAPDQWSALLYGDPDHKSDMQSLIDKQQSPQSFGQSVQELMIALQRTGDPANLSALRGHLKNLAAIDPSSEAAVIPTWKECADAVEAVKHVVNGLVEFVQHHGNRKLQDTSHLSHTARYKISFCRDLSIRGNCPRGQNCTFAHSDEELERYRSKMKKNAIRQSKGPLIYSANIGPNPRVNVSHPPYEGIQDVASRFNKPMPYRSENSLHQAPVTTSQHLMPTYPSGASSNSTPNLSQSQISPKLTTPQGPGNSRFSQIGNNNFSFSYSTNAAAQQNLGSKVGYQNYRPPPLSAPPIRQQFSPEYNKQYSPYSNQMSMSHSPSGITKNSDYFPMPRPIHPNDEFNNNGLSGEGAHYSMNWRSAIQDNKMKMSQLIPKSPMTDNDSNHTSPDNRNPNDWTHSKMEMMRNYMDRYPMPIDEVDNIGINNMFISQKQPTAFQFETSHLAKDSFTRSDSILTSNADDEYSFDAMPLSGAGKYGPIGIKSIDKAKSREWSGLQSMYSMPHADILDDMRMIPTGSTNTRMSQNGNEYNRSIPKDNARYMNSPIPDYITQGQILTSTPRAPADNHKNSYWSQETQNTPNDYLSSDDSLGIGGIDI